MSVSTINLQISKRQLYIDTLKLSVICWKQTNNHGLPCHIFSTQNEHVQISKIAPVMLMDLHGLGTGRYSSSTEIVFCTGPKTGCFHTLVTTFGHDTIGTQKLKKQFFSKISYIYSLKAHAHYFTVLIYLATWRAGKLGISTHLTSINLPWYSQSINSLMYVHYTDSQLLFMNAWSHFFMLLLLLHTITCLMSMFFLSF